ncbi:hypothetical protein ZWY2020_009068 [Hordeum vulgare]|nr:hypothetical protein ZWY2020_009068 [Hordeum vulgare]
MAEMHKYGLSNQPPDIPQILQEAQSRWLRPTEICQILSNYKKFSIAPEPPNRPPSGSLFLFDRKILRYFRKDGHIWRKKKDGKTVKEAHEKLKVGSVDVLHCYYAHGEENENFQRRTYWLLEEGFMNIVLVHYLEIKGGKQSFSRSKEAEDSPACSNSFASQSQVASQTMDAESPYSGQISEYEDAETDNCRASSRYHPFIEMQQPVDGAMMDNRLADLDIKSSSDAFWSSTETVNVADGSSMSIPINEQLDAYVVSPSLSQDELFSIIDVSPSWATLALNIRVACSEVREFEFRDSETQYMEAADPHITGINEMHLHIRLEKLLSLGPDDYENYVLSVGNEKSELISTIGSLMLDDKFTNTSAPADEKEFSATQDKTLEKLVKDKLYYWLIHKIHDDGKGPCVLGKEGQVIHLVAALGYDWAIRPIIAAGAYVNFRDVRGWTALTGLRHVEVQIQNKFRGWKGRKEFMIIRQKIIKIQAHVRGHQVRRNYRKVIWSVGIVEKVILRWRRKGRGLRGGTAEGEDEYDFLKDGRKQAEGRLQRSLARVKSMTQYPEAREQYSRLQACVTELQESKAIQDKMLSDAAGVDGGDFMVDLEDLCADELLDTPMSTIL